MKPEDHFQNGVVIIIFLRRVNNLTSSVWREPIGDVIHLDTILSLAFSVCRANHWATKLISLWTW